MAEAGPGAVGGYVAFISYSHKDAAMGRWLHRKLEGYRLPKRLVGTQGEDGEVPERLTPIFRDRDELPAAGDLSERVRAALAVSRNLIVLCSPHSAASPWVAKEIATFRELHPGRPVFTAIVEGEPGQCFSPALLDGGTEPLAADLRKEGDGRRLGLLKLVAGLTGIGLDRIVQRDAARRVRRVMAITFGAVAAMLAMGVLTILAFSARADAERQRSEAEGLVEFMLTDLRDRLKGVGRLDVVSAVNARALAYYGQGQEVQQLQDQSLGRRARVLQAIGDDNLELHDLESALRAFREAEATTAELVARSPNDAQRLSEHTKSLFGIGRVHELRRQWDLARKHYSDLSVTANRLLALSPRNPDYLVKAGSAAVNLGNLKFNLADTYPPERQSDQYAAAGAYYDRGVRLFDRAADARRNDPHISMALANGLGWLADSYFMRGNWGESLKARMRQYRIMTGLHGTDTLNADYTYHLGVASFGAARSLAKLGHLEEARTHLFESDRLTNDLIQTDKCNADWQAFRLKLDRNLLKLGLGLPPGTSRSKLLERRAQAEEAARRHSTPQSSTCQSAQSERMSYDIR